MEVWIVSKGEVGEGATIFGVYTSEEAAIREGMKIEGQYDKKEWRLVLGNTLEWENGCDRLYVECFPVEGGKKEYGEDKQANVKWAFDPDTGLLDLTILMKEYQVLNKTLSGVKAEAVYRMLKSKK